jgi:hypothetical protein
MEPEKEETQAQTEKETYEIPTVEEQQPSRTDVVKSSIVESILSGKKASPADVASLLLVLDYIDRKNMRSPAREPNPESTAKTIAQAVAEAMKPVVEALKPALETANKPKTESETPEWAKTLMTRIDALESRFKAEEEEKRLRKIIQEEVDSRIAPIAERVSKTESSALTKAELETLIDNIWKRYKETGGKTENLGDIITAEIANLIKDRIQQSLKESLTTEPIEVSPSEKLTKKDIIGVIRQILKTVEKAIPAQAPPRVMPPAPEQPPQAETTTTPAPSIQQAEQPQPAPTAQPAPGQPAGATGGSEGRPVEATAQPPTSEQQ